MAAGVADQPLQWPLLLNGREITVDVFITVYGEELSKIRATAQAALAIKGRHRTWILDDGRSDEVKALAEELGTTCGGSAATAPRPATSTTR